MKTVVIRAVAIVSAALLLATAAPAQLPGGFIHNSDARREAAEKSRAQREKAEAKRTNHLARAAALNNPANYRVVNGQLYNTAFSTNWVTIPGRYERGKFSRMTHDGAAFEIEKLTGGALIRGTGGLTTPHEWYFDRMVIITNYPGSERVTGQPMVPIKVMPVGTSTFFRAPAAIYDFGTPPKPSSSTNSVAKN